MWGKRAKHDKVMKLFSLYIRTKANWLCEYCGKDYSNNHQGLHNSHYHGSRKEGTRYDEDNCSALCAYHHNHLGHGDGREEYKQFMIKKLGLKRYNLLTLRANSYFKKDREMSYLIVKEMYKGLNEAK